MRPRRPQAVGEARREPPRSATAVSSTRWRHTSDKEFFREAQSVGPATVQAAYWPVGPTRQWPTGDHVCGPDCPVPPIRSGRHQIQPPPEILATGTRSGARWSVSPAARVLGSLVTPPASLGRSSSRLASRTHRHRPAPASPSSEGRESHKSRRARPTVRQSPAPISDRHDTCPGSKVYSKAHASADKTTANRIAAAHLRAPDALVRSLGSPDATNPQHTTRWLRGRCAEQRSPSARKAQRAPAAAAA